MKELHFEITNSCNLRCKHCIVDAGKCKEKELNTEQCLDAISIMKEAGIDSLYLTGGEPLCKPDLQAVIEKALDLQLQVQMITNGTLLTDSFLDFLAEKQIPIGISLDGYDEASNDNIRGAGTYKKIMDSLQKIHQRDMSATIYVSATKSNIEHIEDFFLLAKKLSFNIHINDLSIGGRHTATAEYALKSNQDLVHIVDTASQKIFGVPIEYSDDSCWLNTESLVMDSTGNLFLCTEIEKNNRFGAIGNILQFPLKKWIDDNLFSDYMHHSCCYSVHLNEYISMTKNEPVKCAFLCNEPELTSLDAIYEAFDRLHSECSDVCAQCQYPDCKGYTWLLKDESDALCEQDVDVINVNEQVDLLFSFKDAQGNPDLSICQPNCQERFKDGKCAIYPSRPLACRMYPIGPESINGELVWGIHTDCLLVQKMISENTLNDYVREAKLILERISLPIYREILQVYKELDNILSFPNGENNYKIICTMDRIEKE